MVANNAFPTITTTGQGLFDGPSSIGLIQGQAEPDPSTRYRLRSGILSQAETLPMWGGVGVYAFVPPISSSGPSTALGPVLGRATGETGSYPLAGFSVFDQAYNMVNDPASPVATAGSGQSVNYYPLGCLARIAVACDPSLVSVRGGPMNAQVSWDYVNQLLIPYVGTLTISSGTYNSTTGVIVLTMSAGVSFSAGDACILSSLTGTGAYASLDGTWTATAVSGTSVTLQGPVGEGAAAITGGSLTLGSGSDVALPVQVLRVEPTNSMTVEYNATTGLTTWDYSGSAALIQI